MDKLKFITDKLQDNSIHLDIQVKTGLSEKTLRNIKEARHKPNETTVNLIYTYFSRRGMAMHVFHLEK